MVLSQHNELNGRGLVTELTLILIIVTFFSFKQFFNASSPSSNLGEKFPGMLFSEVLHVHMFSISCLLPCNVLLFYYVITNEMPNHFTWIIFFAAKGHDLLCSHSNSDLSTCEDIMLSCMKAHLVFHWCLYNYKCCSINQERRLY